jgi:outer membrane PBP1 activator LpoA protein
VVKVNPDEIKAKLDELLAAIETHADLLALIITRMAHTEAKIEVLLENQREILLRAGEDKEKTKHREDAVYAVAAKHAAELLKPHLESLGQTHKDFGDSQQAQQN